MHEPKVYAKFSKSTIIKKIRDEGFDPVEIYNEPGYIYHLHQHPQTKLLVFLEGNMEVNVDNKTLQCGPGDKLIIPGNIKHSAIVGPHGCLFFWSEKYFELT